MTASEAVEMLGEAERLSAQMNGGYPSIVREVGSFVVVAGEIEGEPHLGVYMAGDVVQWALAAQREYTETPDDYDDVYHAMTLLGPPEDISELSEEASVSE